MPRKLKTTKGLEYERAYDREYYRKNRDKRLTAATTKRRNNVTSGLCSLCAEPVMPNNTYLCRAHWFSKAASRAIGSMAGDAGRFLEQLLENQNYTCPYTGETLIPGINCWIDHKLPVSRFPEHKHDRNNVEWVSKQANWSKGNMTPEEFLSFCSLVADRAKSTLGVN